MGSYFYELSRVVNMLVCFQDKEFTLLVAVLKEGRKICLLREKRLKEVIIFVI
jgi:hypothetical protein